MKALEGLLHVVTRLAPAPLAAALVPTLVALTTVGCASLPAVRPEPPRVSVAGVRPLNLSLTKQRLEFRLLVENPNAYALPLRSLDFVASLAGDRIAEGRSEERVTIPANGDAIVTVDVTAGVDALLGKMRRMLESRTLDLDYAVEGSVRLDNWPRRIPFDVDGVVENPVRSRTERDDGDDGNRGDGDDGGDRDGR